jgi:hypothetical protein
MAANLLDMALIAADATFKIRVQASVFKYAIATIGGAGDQALSNHSLRKNYAVLVLNDPNAFIPDFVWACATNAILAGDVITANAGVNFTVATGTPTAVAAVVTTATPQTTGATESDIDNAVANAWNMMGNC